MCIPSYPLYHLCPFAIYYLRYAVTSFFTISRIYLADDKRAGQKVHRKIAAAVQNVKPSTFCPALLKSEKNIVKNHSFCLDHQTDHYQGDETEGFEMEGLEMER
jgi:hypothetical protein